MKNCPGQPIVLVSLSPICYACQSHPICKHKTGSQENNLLTTSLCVFFFFFFVKQNYSSIFKVNPKMKQCKTNWKLKTKNRVKYILVP